MKPYLLLLLLALAANAQAPQPLPPLSSASRADIVARLDSVAASIRIIEDFGGVITDFHRGQAFQALQDARLVESYEPPTWPRE